MEVKKSCVLLSFFNKSLDEKLLHLGMEYFGWSMYFFWIAIKSFEALKSVHIEDVGKFVFFFSLFWLLNQMEFEFFGNVQSKRKEYSQRSKDEERERENKTFIKFPILFDQSIDSWRFSLTTKQWAGLKTYWGLVSSSILRILSHSTENIEYPSFQPYVPVCFSQVTSKWQICYFWFSLLWHNTFP